MKLVIDISESYYEECKQQAKGHIGTCTTIAKGVPIAEVIEDIKKEIKDQMDDDDYFCGLSLALQIIDKHISGKEQSE